MNGNKLLVSLLAVIGLLIFVACRPATSPTTMTPVPPAATAELPTATVPPTTTPGLPTQLLLIGDSFTSMLRGIDNHFEGLAASTDPPLIVEAESVAIPNASLRRQWDGGKALAAIQDENWTVVVLQEDLSIYAYDEQEFYEYARKFNDEINNMGAETILYMPWEYNKDTPMKTEEIAKVYRNIGTELGVKVAPVGLAWRRSIDERPDLNLYSADLVHGSASGTYLTIAVLYATIFAESPEELPYQPADLIADDEFLKDLWEKWQISEEDIAFLQRIAWETTVAYQEENN